MLRSRTYQVQKEAREKRETVGRMAAVGWVWYQQRGYVLVERVPSYRMVHFGRVLTAYEGAGADTVERLARDCRK